MPRGRRRASAVADAVDAGASAENVQEGIDELLGVAARKGPPTVPDDLGNFKPDAADQPSGPKVVRRRQPEHLETVAEEQAARTVARGEAPDTDAASEDADTAGLETATSGGRAPATVFGDDEGEDETPLSPREQALHDRLAEFERRDLERDARLNEALARFQQPGAGVAPGTGAPAAGAIPGAGDPRITALAQRLRPENILPWRLDDASIARLGGPEAAHTIEGMLRVGLSHVMQLMAEAYTLDQEVNRTQERQAQQYERSQAQVAQAFYTAHPQLEQFADVVNSVSKELADRYPHLRQQPAEWIKHSATETYRKLREWGVQITAPTAPAAARGGGIGNAPLLGPGRRVAPIRPAPADFGGRSGGNSTRRPLTPLQQEMLDLARYA